MISHNFFAAVDPFRQPQKIADFRHKRTLCAFGGTAEPAPRALFLPRPLYRRTKCAIFKAIETDCSVALEKNTAKGANMNGHGLFFRFAMTRSGEMSKVHRHDGDTAPWGVLALVVVSAAGLGAYFLL